MKGLFCGTKACNNEEYKNIIKLRMKISVLLFFMGVLTLLILYLAKNIWVINLSDQVIWTYCGVGTGFSLGSVILLIKNKIILNDEEKLKKSRINNTDERIIEISSKSFKIAAITLLIALYCIGLIGGIFNPALLRALSGLVGIFLLSYVISFKILEKKM